VAIVWLVTDLLAVIAQDSRAFEEEVPIAATAITRFLLSLFLALGLIIGETTRSICRRTFTWVSLLVG
jgi:hypothetical protein